MAARHLKMTFNLPTLSPFSVEFPPIEQALTDPNGLLAVGGDLNPARLLSAYRQGIFPWFSEGQPLLWWSPDPRGVLFSDEIKISRSLKKSLRNKNFQITWNTAFAQVIQACSSPRSYTDRTWITHAIQQAYGELHKLGHAHSVEVWLDQDLVGGLYGVSIGRLFCGESMFSLVPDSSKVALVSLAQRLRDCGFPLIDCQLPNPHLERMGAKPIPRSEFKILLNSLIDQIPAINPWDDTVGTV